MPRLFSYKLTHDTGFAPNPFWGLLTLATCKPRIRLSKGKGDWIAGFTSQSLCGHPVGEERLVYLMEVGDKISFSEYYTSRAYNKKIPNLNGSECVERAGDNIYRPVNSGASYSHRFEQVENPYHDYKNMQRDLSGQFVLTSNRYFYFGQEAISFPVDLRPDVPKGQSAHGSLTHDDSRAQKFIHYVASKYSVGVRGEPHSWPTGDTSWRMK